MEYDNFTKILSPRLKQEYFQRQLKRVAEIASVAKEQLDYEHAHDPVVLKAINIVEKFLRKTNRLCYGGQALNAHLPKAYQFYDPEQTVPDYDFFSPSQDDDIVELVRQFQKAGFTDISVRLGIHEGTIKIYVDYFPVADITQMEPMLYALLSSRRYESNGISYLDADTLRMLIYLELSRPRGEVNRWEKIYERLLLLDNFVPLGKQSSKKFRSIHNPLSKYENNIVMKYIINNGRIFAGADLVNLYGRSLQSKKIYLGRKYPIIFFAKDILKEGEILKDILQDAVIENSRQNKIIKSVTADLYSSINGDMLPGMILLNKGDNVAVLIIQESACHSYYNYTLHTSETLKIASIDTLVTLYFALGIRSRSEDSHISGNFVKFGLAFESLARQLVETSRESRRHPGQFPFPFLSLECEGEQKSFESLIREKVVRMQRQSVKNRLKRLRSLVRIKSRKKLNNTIKNGR